MQRGNLNRDGQPFSKKQRKASRFHNRMKGGFDRHSSQHIDLSKVGAGKGLLAGLLGMMMMGRRKKV